MVTVRTAHKKDLSELTKLFNAYRVFYRMDSDSRQTHLFLAERLKLKDSVIFVAETSTRQLTGFIQLYPLFSSTRLKRLWLLNDLYVTENQRGKGISKSLIAHAKQQAITSKACGLLLETEKTNNIGNTLYPSLQFKLQTNSNFYFWTTPHPLDNEIIR